MIYIKFGLVLGIAVLCVSGGVISERDEIRSSIHKQLALGSVAGLLAAILILI